MIIKIRRGLNLESGQFQDPSVMPEVLPSSVALLGEDYRGLKPVFSAKPGQNVQAGDLLFGDRRQPYLSYVAPASGRILSVTRGNRRALDRLVIRLDDASPRKFTLPATLARENLIPLLLESGCWQSLQTRPFGNVPHPDAVPDALFITAIDTRPLAPDPAVVIGRFSDWFVKGMEALQRLPAGKTWLCHAAGAELPYVKGVDPVGFAGRHPAGLAGTHVHHLHSVGRSGSVWTIGYQDVIAIGHLLAEGNIWTRRVISVGGGAVPRPWLVETVPGADIRELCWDRLSVPAVRLLSGSALDGRAEHYLARGHLQVTAMPHHRTEPPASTLTRKLRSWLARGGRAIIPNLAHEQAAPAGILPIPFLRAISIGDIDTARRLGALELVEEDMALLSHADGGDTDFGILLRRTLDELEAGQ